MNDIKLTEELKYKKQKSQEYIPNEGDIFGIDIDGIGFLCTGKFDKVILGLDPIEDKTLAFYKDKERFFNFDRVKNQVNKYDSRWVPEKGEYFEVEGYGVRLCTGRFNNRVYENNGGAFLINMVDFKKVIK